jgi:hypothetical protein
MPKSSKKTALKKVSESKLVDQVSLYNRVLHEEVIKSIALFMVEQLKVVHSFLIEVLSSTIHGVS